MTKKFFVRAKLVKGRRWVIDFTAYDTAKGTETRQRKDFDLNEIQDLEVREAVAMRIVANIETFATASIKKTQEKDGLPLNKAVEYASTVKQTLPRETSRRKYPTVAKHFIAWARRSGVDKIPVEEFTKRKALEYWDYFLTSKNLRGRTRNNYLASLRALWVVLIDREYTNENPWVRIKPSRKEEKLRRIFTADERRAVAGYAEKNDYWMFRGILLQFYCYIRPTELIRLKFKDFDLGKGLVTVQEGNAKMWRRVVKTIPESVLHYFRDGRFDKYPGNFFIFGRLGDERRGHMEPSTVPIDDERPYKRHAKALKKLKEQGILNDITGLTWYSWKDTGITMHARNTSPLATRDQAGHTDFSMTLTYYHTEETNSEYRNLTNDLIE